MKWLAGKVLRLLPTSLVGRLLPGEFAFKPSSIPPPPAAPETRVRLYIGPVNYAGQGWQWARAVERHLDGVGARNMVVRMSADFSHPADNVVPLGFYAGSARWQRAQFDAVAAGFSHVLVEAQKPPFGAVLDETVQQQVRRLMQAGLRVAMVCHGSDIRLPSRHARLRPESPFHDSMKPHAKMFEKIALRNRRILDELGLPVFVSTPDLLLDVPSAQWLPVVVDPDLWRTDTGVLDRKVPIVAHAPSRAPMKGSDLIDAPLRQLEAEGLIEYARVEKVPFAQMPEIYRHADVVLDQFRIADYGVAACEAMAAGRIVVANVSDHARARAREQAGMDLPIVQSTTDEIADVLRSVLADPDPIRAIAGRGPEFVRRLHNGQKSASVLGEFLS